MCVRCVRVQRLASMLQEAAAEPPAHPWRAAEYPQPYGHSKANGHAPHCIGGEPHFLRVLGGFWGVWRVMKNACQISCKFLQISAY
jgi:hypothetical protein